MWGDGGVAAAGRDPRLCLTSERKGRIEPPVALCFALLSPRDVTKGSARLVAPLCPLNPSLVSACFYRTWTLQPGGGFIWRLQTQG